MAKLTVKAKFDQICDRHNLPTAARAELHKFVKNACCGYYEKSRREMLAELFSDANNAGGRKRLGGN